MTYASGESGTGRGSIYGDEHRAVSPLPELRLGCEHAPRSKALEVQLAGAVRGIAVGWDGVPPLNPQPLPHMPPLVAGSLSAALLP